MAPIQFPVFAVETDGRVHFLTDQLKLAPIGELFLHGEVSLIVDLAGVSYHHAVGEPVNRRVVAGDPVSPEIVIDLVWDRMCSLAKMSTGHRNRLVTRNLDETRLLELAELPKSGLGEAFVLAALLQLD